MVQNDFADALWEDFRQQFADVAGRLYLVARLYDPPYRQPALETTSIMVYATGVGYELFLGKVARDPVADPDLDSEWSVASAMLLLAALAYGNARFACPRDEANLQRCAAYLTAAADQVLHLWPRDQDELPTR